MTKATRPAPTLAWHEFHVHVLRLAMLAMGRSVHALAIDGKDSGYSVGMLGPYYMTKATRPAPTPAWHSFHACALPLEMLAMGRCMHATRDR